MAWRVGGNLQRLRGMRGGLRYLGDDSSNTVQIQTMQSTLTQAQQDLITLANAAAANAQLQATIGAQLNTANQQATALAQQFVSAMTLSNAVAAAVNPVYALQLAAQLSSLETQMGVLLASIANMKAQVSAATINAQNMQQAQGAATSYCAVADAALAAGDAGSYQTYSLLCQQGQQTALNVSNALIPPPPDPNAPFDLGDWLSNNWMYLALGVGAYVVLKKL